MAGPVFSVARKVNHERVKESEGTRRVLLSWGGITLAPILSYTSGAGDHVWLNRPIDVQSV